MSKKFTTTPKQYVKCTTTKEMKDAAKLIQYILTEKKDVFTKYQADRLDEAIGILKNASKYDKDEGLIESSCDGKSSVKGSNVCASMVWDNYYGRNSFDDMTVGEIFDYIWKRVGNDRFEAGKCIEDFAINDEVPSEIEGIHIVDIFNDWVDMYHPEA